MIAKACIRTMSTVTFMQVRTQPVNPTRSVQRPSITEKVAVSAIANFPTHIPTYILLRPSLSVLHSTRCLVPLVRDYLVQSIIRDVRIVLAQCYHDP